MSLYYEVGKWAEKTFDKSTPESVFIHLKREIKELGENLTDGEEMADVIMLVAHLAYKADIDLVSEIRHKFEVNQNRIWSRPDSEGVCSHIEEAGE